MKVEWNKHKLRDVCELINGRAYSKPELLSEGKYRVLRVGNFFTSDRWYYSDLELEDRKYCESGDLLYAWSASFGPRIWKAEKVIFHYHIWKVAHEPALIDQNFLFNFFLWDMEKIKEDQGTGTTMIHVSKGSMDDRDILVPPLAEQHRIVAILDEAFENIASAKANAEQNLKNARALFESHLQAVFTQRGEGWVEKPLATICEVEYGYTEKAKVKGDYRFVRITDTDDSGRLTNEDKKYIDSFAGADRYLLKEGDLLMARTGASAGNLLLFEGNEKAIFASYLIRMRFKKEIVSKLYWYFSKSQLYWNQVQQLSAGSAQPQFNGGALKQVTFRYPKSLVEQYEIISKFDELVEETQRLESIYKQKIAALDELKKALLHKAFAGEL